MSEHLDTTMNLRAIGVVQSPIVSRDEAPRQGDEGAPDAWIELTAAVRDAADRLAVGDAIVLITWFDRSDRDVLRVRPRRDAGNAVRGVFATRSPDRPNPLGLHPVTIKAIDGLRLLVGPLEALDGTPVVDIKPQL